MCCVCTTVCCHPSPPLPLLPLQLLLAKEAKKIAKSCSRVKTRKQPASTGAAAMAASLGEDSHCHLPHLAPQQEARSQQPPHGHLPQLKAVSQLTEQTSQQQAHGGWVHTCTHTHTHTCTHTHMHTHAHTCTHTHTHTHAHTHAYTTQTPFPTAYSTLLSVVFLDIPRDVINKSNVRYLSETGIHSSLIDF